MQSVAFVVEPWVIALVSLLGGVFMGGITKAFWVGRNAVTVADLHKVRDELRTDIADERRDVGEGLKAIRQKTTDIELDLAKNYVRKDAWAQSISQFQETMSKNDSADQQWKLRIEDKIDQLSERIAGHPPRGRS